MPPSGGPAACSWGCGLRLTCAGWVRWTYRGRMTLPSCSRSCATRRRDAERRSRPAMGLPPPGASDTGQTCALPLRPTPPPPSLPAELSLRCKDAGLQVSDTAPLRCVLMRLCTLAEVWVAFERLDHAMWQVKGCRSSRRSRRRMMRRTAAPPSPRLAAQARTLRPSRFPTDAEGLCHRLLVGGLSDILRYISCY